jgi:hypothetical protein
MSNITNEPAFRDRLGGDLRLRPDSPCIDTGDDSVVQAGWLDLDGQPHILGNHVDMGAYEFSGAFVVDGLNPPGFRADGVFGFEFFALPGVRYVIEYRTTLSATGAVWQVLTNLTGSGGNAPVLDPGAAGPQRFYRAHTE